MEKLRDKYNIVLAIATIVISLGAFKDELNGIEIHIFSYDLTLTQYLIGCTVALAISLYLFLVEQVMHTYFTLDNAFTRLLLHLAFAIYTVTLTTPLITIIILLAQPHISEILSGLIIVTLLVIGFILHTVFSYANNPMAEMQSFGIVQRFPENIERIHASYEANDIEQVIKETSNLAVDCLHSIQFVRHISPFLIIKIDTWLALKAGLITVDQYNTIRELVELKKASKKKKTVIDKMKLKKEIDTVMELVDKHIDMDLLIKRMNDINSKHYDVPYRKWKYSSDKKTSVVDEPIM